MTEAERIIAELQEPDDDERPSVIVNVEQQRQRSLRPSSRPGSRAKITGIVLGVLIGLAAVAELMLRVLPIIIDALK